MRCHLFRFPQLAIRLSLLTSILFFGCVRISGPHSLPNKSLERPSFIESYYSKGRKYTRSEEFRVQPTRHYTIRRILLHCDTGTITFDYYQQRNVNSSELVLVFPVLGGKPIIESYLADYLARHGYDTAIIHRNDEFRDPKLFDMLETVFHKNIVRDRIVLDFFEKQYGKSNFAGVGMSRGAINLATLAGIDSRLKYNVFILGATDLASIFKESNERRIKAYVEKVTDSKGLDKQGFKDLFRRTVFTEPLSFARYIKSDQSLLILATFDKTVPVKYGLKFRRQLGNPDTIFLFAEHFTSVLYTQILKLIPLTGDVYLFPFDYVEGETLQFLDQAFGRPLHWWHLLPLRVVQAPFNIITQGVFHIFGNSPERLDVKPDIVKVVRNKESVDTVSIN